ncbi:rhomboid family intramembrane serine protease [Halalkalibacter sp. AB-rgal2]|uniref:rhomboid family intramembrane serine protease n=1 Tax=Halalkalibacter sp. AB-rgal2 TaxID=3242695 RepID=UPI00359CE3BC
MDQVRLNYLFWMLVHDYVTKKKWRLISMRDQEVWLVNEKSKPRQIVRFVRRDLDWAGELRRDVEKAVILFESIRTRLHYREVEGKNIYVSLYPPVDDWEDIQKPLAANKRRKSRVFSTVLTKDEIEKRDLRDLYYSEQVEQLELHTYLLKQQIKHVHELEKEKEKSMFQHGKPYATYFLLVSIAMMFIITEWAGSSTDIMTLIDFGAKYNPRIMDGEWWRFISAMFLHIGVIHLFMNSLALFFLGGVVERMYGTTRFVIIYLIAGLLGSIASFAFNASVSAGASGAIFGCFGALLYFGFVHPSLFFRTMGKNVIVILAINLVFGFVVPVVDNGAHIGGLVGGFLAAAIVQLPKQHRTWKRFVFAIITLIVIASLIAFGWVNEAKMTNVTTELIIGQMYLQDDEVEAAYPHVKRAYEMEPTMPEATFLLSVAQAMNGNYAEALPLLEKTVEIRADFHEAHYNMAVIYTELGEYEQARTAVARAIEIEAKEEYVELERSLTLD